jgi:N-acetylmuramic acid 6-phosphate (MurNAc-6-P) etherase
MAVSDLARLALTTDVGIVDVTVQNGRTFYVRAGLADEKLLDGTTAPLDLGRGVAVTFRAHFKLQPDGAVKCDQPFLHRVDQGRDKDPTRKMIDRAISAIGEKLTEHAKTPEGRAALAAAQRDVNERNADQRDKLAAELQRVAAHLELEAVALRAGGRLTYRERRLTSGYSEQIQRVERHDGTLMDVCPEPPTVYGSSRYPAHGIRSETETD